MDIERAERLIAAFANGVVKALADVPAAPAPTAAPTAPSEPSVVEATLPTPSFDPEQEELPLIPPATLRDMERAMDSIVRGNGVPEGFYNPEDADTRAPLS